ncbi:hypothetical protein HK100_005892 [Physocladia obscura]|uniref:Uncharacterized protein n=1 Tax=Physocladia obscura TaxID=109957 RepID=A0AAD5SQZ4_9FUNG|nr:hypothetical protein HK100_005892 [Physocladia obscura]
MSKPLPTATNSQMILPDTFDSHIKMFSSILVILGIIIGVLATFIVIGGILYFKQRQKLQSLKTEQSQTEFDYISEQGDSENISISRIFNYVNNPETLELKEVGTPSPDFLLAALVFTLTQQEETG